MSVLQGIDRTLPSAIGGITIPQDDISTATVTIELGNRTFAGTAEIADPLERRRLWDQHVVALPHFAGYPDQTGRVIPVVQITPDGEG